MKKALSILLVLLLALTVFAAGSKEESSVKKDYSSYSLEALKKEIVTINSGKLTVATSPDYAPYEFYAIDSNGKATLAGFDMDLAKYIANYLGLELDIIPMDFDGTLLELQNGNVDLSMAGYSPDPDRAEAMEFSDVYYEGGQCFLTTVQNKSKFSTLENLNNSKLSVAAQIGSIQMGLAEEYSKDTDIIALTKVTDIIAEVLAGKIDGAYVETIVAESAAKNYPSLTVAMEVPYDAEGNVVGVKKGNYALLEGVNRAIKAALEDGSFAEYVSVANELANGEIYEGLFE